MSDTKKDKKEMPQYLSVQIDDNLKNAFANFCDRHYMTISDATLMLARQTIKLHKIPFRIEDQNSKTSDVDVSKPKQSKPTRLSVRMSRETQEEFTAACEDIGITRSALVRMFYGYCVDEGHLPYSWADE